MSERKEDFDLILVKLRDWLQAAELLREEIDGYLNDKENALTKVIEKTYDLDKISWEAAQGQKGPFEIAREEENRDNADYQALLEDLIQHKGKMTHKGFFIWLFPDETAVGRKKKKKPEEEDGLPLHLRG